MSNNPSSRPLLQAIGLRVAALRLAQGLTQYEAAELAGLSQGQWSNLEKGRHDPQLTTLLRVQQALEVDFVEAFFGPGPSRNLLDE